MADQATSTDLIISLPAVPSVATFTDEKEFDKLYSAILEKVEQHKPDVSTRKGREDIASLAYKVARTKTTLDKQGKDLTEEWRSNTTKVNATRNVIKERLDALQKQVRQPLDAWEEAEAARVTSLQAKLDMLLSFCTLPPGRAFADLKEYLGIVEQTSVDETWEEFQDRGELAKADATAALNRLIIAAEKQEADARELEQLRAAQAERDRLDAERREAEEKAKAEALREERERLAEQQRKDALAQAAADAAAKAEREAAERVAAAERAAKEAQEKAERDIANAKALAERKAEADRQRIAAEKAAEEAEQRRRDADRDHRKAVNNAIIAELIECSGITEEQAKKIVVHIHGDLVPHVSLKY